MNSEIERVTYGLPVHDHEEENAVLEVIKSHKTIMGEKVLSTISFAPATFAILDISGMFEICNKGFEIVSV